MHPAFVQAGLLLLVHGEVTDPEVDFFDREKVFIETKLKPLLDKVRGRGELSAAGLAQACCGYAYITSVHAAGLGGWHAACALRTQRQLKTFMCCLHARRSTSMSIITTWRALLLLEQASALSS